MDGVSITITMILLLYSKPQGAQEKKEVSSQRSTYHKTCSERSHRYPGCGVKL